MKILKAALISLALVIVLFGILTKTGISETIINYCLVKLGYDFYQGEDRVTYIMKIVPVYAFVLFLVIFLIVYFVFFKKRKK